MVTLLKYLLNVSNMDKCIEANSGDDDSKNGKSGDNRRRVTKVPEEISFILIRSEVFVLKLKIVVNHMVIGRVRFIGLTRIVMS